MGTCHGDPFIWLLFILSCFMSCELFQLFSFVYLPFIGRWHSHPWPYFSFIPFVFDHFASQLALVSLVVQSHKCIAWSPSSLPTGFTPPHGFWCLPNDIRVLGVPLALCHYPLHFCKPFWMRTFAKHMCFESWGMFKWFLKSYLDVLHKDLFICFMFSRPSQASSAILLPFTQPFYKFLKGF